MSHIPTGLLQEFLDGVPGEEERARVSAHLAGCPECRSSLDALRALDRALRQMPAETAPGDFTTRVMRRLGLEDSPSFVWAILKNVAPVVGLAVVVTILLVVLRLTGTVSGSDVDQSVEATRGVYDAVRSGLGTGFSAFSTWIQGYLAFAFAKSTYTLTTFLLIFLGVVALLDKFVFMPMIRRRVAQSR